MTPRGTRERSAAYLAHRKVGNSGLQTLLSLLAAAHDARTAAANSTLREWTARTSLQSTPSDGRAQPAQRPSPVVGRICHAIRLMLQIQAHVMHCGHGLHRCPAACSRHPRRRPSTSRTTSTGVTRPDPRSFFQMTRVPYASRRMSMQGGRWGTKPSGRPKSAGRVQAANAFSTGHVSTPSHRGFTCEARGGNRVGLRVAEPTFVRPGAPARFLTHRSHPQLSAAPLIG
jgi:hypothetical protein